MVTGQALILGQERAHTDMLRIALRIELTEHSFKNGWSMVSADRKLLNNRNI